MQDFYSLNWMQVEKNFASFFSAGYLRNWLSHGWAQYDGFGVGEPDACWFACNSDQRSVEAVCWVEDNSDFFAHVSLEHVEYGRGQFSIWHGERSQNDYYVAFKDKTFPSGCGNIFMLDLLGERDF